MNEVKNEILNITKLVTTTALTTVENKVLNVNNLLKKIQNNTKIRETENDIITDHDHDKCITTQKFKS